MSTKEMKLIMENWRHFVDEADLVQTQNQINKILSESLHKVSRIKDPFFRKKLKKFSVNADGCQVYLKKANNEIKYVDFTTLVERRDAGKITSDEVHEIWESSCKYDVDMFGRYSNLYVQLSDEMSSTGLIREDGSVTKKGKFLQEREENLTEQQINEIVNNLLLEQEDEELSPEERAAAQTTGRRAAGAVGGALKKGAKAVGKVVAAPFKLLKWFRDKIWAFIEGMLKKIFAGIKQLGEKWDIKWIKNLVGMMEAVAEKIESICGKNKLLTIICGIIKSLLVAYAVKLFITAFLALIGSSFTVLAGVALSGCASGAATAVVSEEKQKQLIKEDAALCDAAVRASSATASYVFKMVKGLIKHIAARGDQEVSVAKEALNFIDKFSEKYYSGLKATKFLGIKLGSDAPLPTGATAAGVGSEEALAALTALKEAAQGCASEGAELVVYAISIVKRSIKLAFDATAALGPTMTDQDPSGGFFDQLARFGDATTAKVSMENYTALTDLADKAMSAHSKGDYKFAIEAFERLKRLAEVSGFDVEGTKLDDLFNMASRSGLRPPSAGFQRQAAAEFGKGAVDIARRGGKAAWALRNMPK